MDGKLQSAVAAVLEDKYWYETEFLYYPASDYFHSVLNPAHEVFDIEIDEKHPMILLPPPIPVPSGSTATFENPDGGDQPADKTKPDYDCGQVAYPLIPPEEAGPTDGEQSTADTIDTYF